MLRHVLKVLICGFVVGAGLFHPARLVAKADEPIRVYVFAGQSNMVGKDTRTSDLAHIAPAALSGSPSALFWGPISDFPASWGPLKPPTEIIQPRHHQGFGPEIGAAPKLSDMHPDSTIAIVKYAVSGTSLNRDWDPDRSGGLYDQLIDRVREAMDNMRLTRAAPVRLAGFFWMQGEADSEKLTHANAYERNLAKFIRSVRRDLRAPKLPFVLGRITDLRRESRAHFRYSGVVRAAQGDVARTVPLTYIVSTDKLERAAAQRIHFSSRGTYDLGRSFVRSSYPL